MFTNFHLHTSYEPVSLELSPAANVLQLELLGSILNERKSVLAQWKFKVVGVEKLIKSAVFTNSTSPGYVVIFCLTVGM